MRPILLCLALLSACAPIDIATNETATPVRVGEYVVNVGAMSRPVGYYAARDADTMQFMVTMAPAHIRIEAIEKLTGCRVDPLTVSHPTVAHTTARVIC